MENIEVWLPIPAYRGIYEASSYGRIRRVTPIGKLSVENVDDARRLRKRGMKFREIAEIFGVSKRAIISALTYKCKRRPHREPFRIIAQHSSKPNYYPVLRLCSNNVPRTHSVYRLVAEAFHGPCPIGKEINHKDGDRTNSRPENLEYVTRSENAIHAHRVLGVPGTSLPGSENPYSKLTEPDIILIRKLAAESTPISFICAQFKICRSSIWKITTHRSWTHVK